MKKYKFKVKERVFIILSNKLVLTEIIKRRFFDEWEEYVLSTEPKTWYPVRDLGKNIGIFVEVWDEGEENEEV